MDIRPILNEQDHLAALKEIERLWGAAPNTSDGDKLDVLATLVEKYEDERFPAVAGDPIDILKYALKDMGRSQNDLAKLLGSRSRASEVMSRRRKLTLEMIRKISAEWNIPIELLARSYNLSNKRMTKRKLVRRKKVKGRLSKAA